MPDGTRILDGKYELIAPAGVGGMATVWRGLLHGDAGFSRSVAIKRMHAWVGEQERGVEMFLQEARLVAELAHPHIVQVLDFQQDPADDRYVIVLEWVDGLDFGRYLRTCLEQHYAPPWPVLVGIVIEVLRALSAAHEHRTPDGTASPVYHRDVSPSNVLVSLSGITKLTDFGMARAMDRVTTRPGVLQGKLAYMAPEYMATGDATPATDLYAAGVMLWEGLAGRRLRDGTDQEEISTETDQEVPALSDLREDLPEELVRIVGQALEKEPEARFASARKMERALRDLVRSTDHDTEPVTIGATVAHLLPLVNTESDEPVEESGEYPPQGTIPPSGLI